MLLDENHVSYLTSHGLGRLATVTADGAPQNKPVGYRYNAVLGTIDIGGYAMERSAKYRNIAASPMVSFVVDDSAGQGAEGMRFLEARGRAEQAPACPDGGGPVIRIHPTRVVSWNIPGRPGLHTAGPLPAGTGPAQDAAWLRRAWRPPGNARPLTSVTARPWTRRTRRSCSPPSFRPGSTRMTPT